MNKITLAIALSSFLALSSCNSEKPEENKPLTDSATAKADVDTAAYTVDDLVRFKFDFAFGNIPSPAEVVNDMSSYKIVYNNAYLADASKAKSYKTDFSKATNLGIYNLDMAYAISNAQGSDVLKYLKTSMVEIDALDMKSAFDSFIGKRTETNIGNRDSLLKIIDEMYVKGDTYLRTNQRVETATYIFVGSWIEALHLICKTGADEKDAIQKARLNKHLWDQRFYLKNMIDLLEEFKNPDAKWLKDDLTVIYKEIEPVSEYRDFKAKNFSSFYEKLEALRTKLMQ